MVHTAKHHSLTFDSCTSEQLQLVKERCHGVGTAYTPQGAYPPQNVIPVLIPKIRCPDITTHSKEPCLTAKGENLAVDKREQICRMDSLSVKEKSPYNSSISDPACLGGKSITCMSMTTMWSTDTGIDSGTNWSLRLHTRQGACPFQQLTGKERNLAVGKRGRCKLAKLRRCRYMYPKLNGPATCAQTMVPVRSCHVPKCSKHKLPSNHPSSATVRNSNTDNDIDTDTDDGRC